MKRICKTCTFENAELFLSCEMCGVSLEDQPDPSQIVRDAYQPSTSQMDGLQLASCSVCSYDNPAHAVLCGMCSSDLNNNRKNSSPNASLIVMKDKNLVDYLDEPSRHPPPPSASSTSFSSSISDKNKKKRKWVGGQDGRWKDVDDEENKVEGFSSKYKYKYKYK